MPLPETGARPEQLSALVASVPPGTGVSLAVVRGDALSLSCHGRTDGVAGERVTPETGFEVGSVTKTFTALLLAELAARGELGYADPIDVWLAPEHRPTLLRGGPITLLHLATHTSGLPRLPPGLLRSALPRWYTNPYEAFTGEQLLHSLARTRVRTRPGSRVRYSNFGVGLLARLLADAAGGGDYAGLLAERVCGPLGLLGTGCAPNPLSQAVGHRRGRAQPPWRIPGLAGAGAVRSTGRDLARFLQAHLAAGDVPGRAGAAGERAGPPPPGPTQGWAGPGPLWGVGGVAPDGRHAMRPLATALREVQRQRLVRPRTGDGLCLVWNVRRRAGRDLLFHSGGTRGFTAFVGFSPQDGAGVAALANSAPALDGRFVQAAYDLLRSFLPDCL